jgi:uncharacterized protein YndB with AHSA1/START domain
MTRQVRLTTPLEREIVLAREFDAPRRMVFDAFTRPELLVRWYGATGWRLVGCDVDLRVGGRYRFESHGPHGATMVQQGTYQEITPPARLVLTELFDEQSYPGESLITHEFTEGAGRTTVTSTILFATAAGRDTALGYPMARGVSEGYGRLDEVLTHAAAVWSPPTMEGERT